MAYSYVVGDIVTGLIYLVLRMLLQLSFCVRYVTVTDDCITLIYLVLQSYTVYESYNYPNHYIRHSSYRLMISLEDGTDKMHQDASFRETTGKKATSNSIIGMIAYNFQTVLAI